MVRHDVVVRLPTWVDDFLATTPTPGPDPESRIRFVIALARRNVVEETGGPFGAAVFVDGEPAPISVGVNRVVAERCSAAHAEILALSLAQQELGDFDLGAAGRPAAQLVSSSTMCAMCLGDVCWSGVRSVVFATNGADVEGIVGFDEGPCPVDVVDALARRGIAVVPEVLRAEGQALLRLYRERGGPVYNGRGAVRPLS